LQAEDELTEIVQLVGKDSLAESDKITLEVARLIKDDFLQQNGFTKYDRFCPFYKTFWMTKNIVTFYNLAQKAVEASTDDKRVTFAAIRTHTGDLMYKLTSMKFQDPNNGEDKVVEHMKGLNREIHELFRSLDDSL